MVNPGNPGERRLERAARAWLRRRELVADDRPRTAFDVQIKQRVDDHARELAEIRTRVNTMFFLIIGGVAIDVVLRLLKS